MANYQTIPVAQPERSPQHNTILSVGTTDFGRLQPIKCLEVVPGDKISFIVKSFVRGAPPSVPTYGRIRVNISAFFVPNRILWTDWDNYIAGNTDSTPPYITINQLNSLINAYKPTGEATYTSEQAFQLAQDIERVLSGLGYSRALFAPPSANNSYMNKRISTLPFRAYRQIWWDYFRDSVNISETTKQTYLNPSLGANTGYNTVDNPSLNSQAYYRCYSKDYLTTSLPSANGTLPSIPGNSSLYGAVPQSLSISSSTNTYNSQNYGSTSNQINGTTIPIQAIRAANALQRYIEKNNIVGTRLISRLLARFGVAPSAERLQRAELLGTHDFIMNMTDIDSDASTDITGGDTNQVYNAFGSAESFANIRGQSTGKLTGGKDSPQFSYSSTEHGHIIILQSIMPDESYYQGIERMLIRGLSTPNADRFDFYTPEFENLGYQPVLASDVYAPQRGDRPTFFDSYDPNKVFGYQPRYSDYKFQRHQLFGDFTSSIFNTGMDSFHLFRDLSFFGKSADQTSMVVSDSFNQLSIQERLQYDRIFQIPYTKVSAKIGSTQTDVTATLDHFQLYNRIEYHASRPMTGDDMPELVDGENDGKKISVPTGGIRM